MHIPKLTRPNILDFFGAIHTNTIIAFKKNYNFSNRLRANKIIVAISQSFANHILDARLVKRVSKIKRPNAYIIDTRFNVNVTFYFYATFLVVKLAVTIGASPGLISTVPVFAPFTRLRFSFLFAVLFVYVKRYTKHAPP